MKTCKKIYNELFLLILLLLVVTYGMTMIIIIGTIMVVITLLESHSKPLELEDIVGSSSNFVDSDSISTDFTHVFLFLLSLI